MPLSRCSLAWWSGQGEPEDIPFKSVTRLGNSPGFFHSNPKERKRKNGSKRHKRSKNRRKDKTANTLLKKIKFDVLKDLLASFDEEEDFK